jgi:CHAD domain-containing protein
MSEVQIRRPQAARRGAAVPRDAAAGAPPVKAAPPPWSGRQVRALDGHALLRRMVGACLAQIEPNAAAIAHGSRDPEHVHQLRIGLRRLRSAARGMAPFDAAMPHGWEPAVMPLFDALGRSRDRHVRATILAPKLRAAGAALVDDAPPSEEDARVLARRAGAAGFVAAVERLRAFAQDLPGEAAAGEGGGLSHLVERLRRLQRQATRHARHLDELPFEAQHRARKRLKRLRYLAEFAAPAFAPGDVRRWMRAAATAQEALGKHVDRVLAGRHFAQRAVSEPDAWFAVGWLRAKSERSGRAARDALLRLRDADVFW